MKSCCFIVLSSLLFISTSYGQKQHRFSAGISFGPSIPLGTYASKSLTDPSAGLAQTGLSLNLSGVYRISKMIGITAVVGGQMNKVSESAFEEGVRQADTSFETLNLSVKTKSWQVGKVMGGADFRIPVSEDEKVVIKAAVLAGSAKIQQPGYSFTVSDGTSTASASQKGYTFPWLFCYGANAGVSFRLTKMISLTGTASYFHARPVLTYRYFDNGELYQQTEVKYPITSLSAEAGIEIQL